MAIDDLWYLTRQRDPATGKPLPSKRHGRGMRWRVRYEDDAGEKVERLFERKPDAVNFDAGVRTDVNRGLYVDPTAGKVTVAKYAEQYREAQPFRGSTDELVERAFRLHIGPTLGARPIAAVRPSHVQAWVKGLDLAPATVRVLYAVLSGMFTAAARDRAIGVSPCTDITLPPLPHIEHLILTPAQVHALAAGLPARYRAAVYLGAGCGLRHGEVLGLERGHVDFLRREVQVVQQLTSYNGRKPYLGPLKTKTSRRVVELPQVTADALARHFAQFPSKPIELEDDTDPRHLRTVRSADLLFTNAAGRPIYRASWSPVWSSVARSVGLPAGTGFHALRHYFATLLIFSGANVKAVQLALGHSSPTITLNTYVGLWPDQLDRTRTLVDAALGTTMGTAVAT
jgi:integrase